CRCSGAVFNIGRVESNGFAAIGNARDAMAPACRAPWNVGSKPASRLRPGADAAGRGGVGLAGGLAGALRFAFVDDAAEAVDEPGAFVGRTFEADVAGANGADQHGEQDRG